MQYHKSLISLLLIISMTVIHGAGGGLHDMLGNVAEWCQDYNTKHTAEPQVGPIVRARAPWRVTREGS